MREVALVFFGGGLGSVVRYLLGKWVNTFHNSPFPFATLSINVIACFVLGLIIGLADHKQFISPDSRIFWTIGFCGGFSTFSTFSAETLVLIQNGMTTESIVYVAASLVLCVGGTFVGLWLPGVLSA